MDETNETHTGVAAKAKEKADAAVAALTEGEMLIARAVSCSTPTTSAVWLRREHKDAMRDESFHDNTADGEIAVREYAADAADETRPFHPHECPGCHYLGCHFGGSAGRERYDLFLCGRFGGPDLVTRFGPGPKDWAAVELEHAASLPETYHYSAAISRAAELASPDRHLAAMKAAMDESDRLIAAHEAGGPRGPAVLASERARACFLALYRRIGGLTESGHAVYLRGRWRDGEPLAVRSLGSDRGDSSIHFDEDSDSSFFPRVCRLRDVESIEVVDEEPVRRALAHPWVASRVEASLARITDDESLHAALREDLLGFITSAARSAMLIRLPPHPEYFSDGTAVHNFFITRERARWLDVEVPRLMHGLRPLDPTLRAHAPAVREAREHLAQLAYLLVTLARVRPGELPAGEGFEGKPWLRLVESALLPQ